MACLRECPKAIVSILKKEGQWKVESMGSPNHKSLLGSIETCQGNAEIPKEKWLSITNHVVNRLSNQQSVQKMLAWCSHWRRATKRVAHSRFSTTQWIAKIVHDTRLFKTVPHLTDCVRTTALAAYHSLYLIHLPKHTHFSHEVVEEATKLIALDHNHNTSRQQVRQ